MAYLSNTVATEVYMAQQRIHYFAKQIAELKYRAYHNIPAGDLKSIDYYLGMMASTETMIECLLMAHNCYAGYQNAQYVGRSSFYAEYHAYDLRKAIRPSHQKVLFEEEAA